MVSHISPSGKFEGAASGDLQTLKDWAQQLEAWSNKYPDSAKDLFNSVRAELDKFIRASTAGVHYSPALVKEDLEREFFQGVKDDHGVYLDIYANSGFTSAEPAQELMKIFGIDPPPVVTAMDKVFFGLQEYFNKNPKSEDGLLADLHEKIFDLGSNGSLKDPVFIAWIQAEKATDAYKNSPNQDLFNKLLNV